MTYWKMSNLLEQPNPGKLVRLRTSECVILFFGGWQTSLTANPMLVKSDSENSMIYKLRASKLIRLTLVLVLDAYVPMSYLS